MRRAWQKFGATRTVEDTLGAKSVGTRPAEAGSGQHDDHRHTSGLLVLDRFDSGLALVRRKRKAVCLQPSSLRRCACIGNRKGGGSFLCRKLSSLAVGRVGRRWQVELRGHSMALVRWQSNQLASRWSGEAKCEMGEKEKRRVKWCSAGVNLSLVESVRGSSYPLCSLGFFSLLIALSSQIGSGEFCRLEG